MLEETLSVLGPCLSTQLVEALVSQGVSPEAARQRVSRAGGAVKKLRYLPFPRKAKFVYLARDYRSPRYWSALIEAVIKHSPAYGAALAAVISRGGVLPVSHFVIACGAPLQQKKHLSATTILDRLQLAGVLTEIDLAGVGPCVTLANRVEAEFFDTSALRARLIVEDILLRAIQDWLRKLAMASYFKIALRGGDAPPRVGTFAWDLTAPSYLSALTNFGKDRSLRPGFVVCDVLMRGTVDDTALEPFIKKCLTLRQLKSVGRCLQLFVAERYSEQALARARQIGIIPATPASLFGRDVADGLVQLANVLTTAARASVDPAVFDELFRKLSKIEGAAVNLRGALFELIIAELVRQLEPGRVSINEIVRDASTGQHVEVDVLLEQQRQKNTFIECKGYQPSQLVSDADVSKWLREKIPFIRAVALVHPQWKDAALAFEFWTSGKFSPAAEEMLVNAANTTKKYSIGFKDGTALKQYAQTLKGSPLLKTLNEHFFSHPLAIAEEVADMAPAVSRADLAALRPPDDLAAA